MIVKRIAVLSLCLIFSLPNIARAEIPWSDLNLPATQFAESSRYHKVNSTREDPYNPGFLIFSVSNNTVKIQVEGLLDLKKWIHESAVIGQLDEHKDTASGVADGAIESVKGTGRGLKNLVLHPVNSAKGLGTAAGRVGDKVGDAFRTKEEGEKGDSFLSSTKRQIAQKLGVDVYSRNEQLQEKLSSLAKQEMGGRGVVMVANFFIPFGLIASAVMTVSNINNTADQLVNDKDRIDLYKINKDSLVRIGIPENKSIALLNNTHYTPRQATYLRFYLERLASLRGYKMLADRAAELTEDVPARKFLHEMQMAADGMAGMNDAVSIDMVPEGLLLERKDSVLLICGYDYLTDSPLGKKLIEKVGGYKAKLKKNSAEIWNAGIVMPKLSGLLLVNGIKVRRMCLFLNASDSNTATV
jgi:hypothetical protein